MEEKQPPFDLNIKNIKERAYYIFLNTKDPDSFKNWLLAEKIEKGIDKSKRTKQLYRSISLCIFVLLLLGLIVYIKSLNLN